MHGGSRTGVIAALALQLGGCAPIGEGSCDFPGQCDDPIQPRSNTVTLRTVTDADTGEPLCSACEGCTMITPVVGQRLVIEDRLHRVQARNEVYGGVADVPFGCNAERSAIDPEVNVWQEIVVQSLRCFRAPEASDVFRIHSMEVLELSQPTMRREPLAESSEMGHGYRYELEVLGPGLVALEPSGECEAAPRPRPLVDFMCGEGNACGGSLACMTSDCRTCVADDWLECHWELPSICHGGCAPSACDADLECPGTPLQCVEGRCEWKSTL